MSSLCPKRRIEIARIGGKSVKAENRAYSKDRELAKRAGRKGGEVTSARNKRRSELLPETNVLKEN